MNSERLSAIEIQKLSASAENAERELLAACNALYLVTDKRVADDIKRKACAVIETHTAFYRSLYHDTLVERDELAQALRIIT